MRERRGWSGSTTGAINSSPPPPFPMVVGIGLAVTTLVLQQQQPPRRYCDIEPRINYPHAKTYYRAIDKTDAPQLGLARSRVLRVDRHEELTVREILFRCRCANCMGRSQLDRHWAAADCEI